MLPSFPQRGQAANLPILELPDDAPKVLKDWIGRIAFTKQMVRYFSLVKPEIESVRREMNQGIIQLLGQSVELSEAAIQGIVARIVSSMGDDELRNVVMTRDGDDPLRSLPIEWDFTIIRGLRSARAAYPAAQFAGRLYYETDTQLTYFSNGSLWYYAYGTYRNTLANILTGLGTGDVNLRNEVTDYSHVLVWNGTTWQWGDGDVGSGWYQLFESAPSGYGASAWAAVDGSTVARLNADGSTTNVTLDDVTTAAYLKGALASAAVAAASGTVANTVATNQATVVDAHAVVDDLAAGVGNANFATPGDAVHASHNHTQDTHNHGAGTLELRNFTKRLYYRR